MFSVAVLYKFTSLDLQALPLLEGGLRLCYKNHYMSSHLQRRVYWSQIDSTTIQEETSLFIRKKSPDLIPFM